MIMMIKACEVHSSENQSQPLVSVIARSYIRACREKLANNDARHVLVCCSQSCSHGHPCEVSCAIAAHEIPCAYWILNNMICFVVLFLALCDTLCVYNQHTGINEYSQNLFAMYVIFQRMDPNHWVKIMAYQNLTIRSGLQTHMLSPTKDFENEHVFSFFFSNLKIAKWPVNLIRKSRSEQTFILFGEYLCDAV